MDKKTVHPTSGRSAKRLPWTIVLRSKSDHVELVRVPLTKNGGPEHVLRVIRGRALRTQRGHARSLWGDASGKTALDAFRIAVREAKAK